MKKKILKIEEKYNLEKYKTLVKDQEKVVASIERRLKAFEDQRASVIRSMNAKNFLSEKLYKERELYVLSLFGMKKIIQTLKNYMMTL